jgi:hypothetical protein
MGGLMGLAGVEHGVGEMLQGGGVPHGIMIQSWPDAAFFQSLNGEPAMTILRDLRLTGMLAILLSLLFTAWAVFWAQRRHGGLVMMLLAVAMLLFGGGIFPPVLGFFIGIAAAGLRAKPNASAPRGLNRIAGQGWAWIFALCCLAWLALFPGIAALDYFFGVESMALTLTVMLAAFALLFLALWSGAQHDRLPRDLAV